MINLTDTLSFDRYDVDGSDGNDTITTFSGDASVQGGLGDDKPNVTVLTRSGDVSAGEGNDVIVVTALAGRAQGDAGNDTVTNFLLLTGAGVAVVEGGTGDDTLTIRDEFAFGTTLPGNGAVFRGGDGNDSLIDLTLPQFVNADFVFTTGWGQDSIAGYDEGADRIRFEGTAGAGLDDFADLTITGDATQTLITFGADTVLLDGLDVALFSAADVTFA